MGIGSIAHMLRWSEIQTQVKRTSKVPKREDVPGRGLTAAVPAGSLFSWIGLMGCWSAKAEVASLSRSLLGHGGLPR